VAAAPDTSAPEADYRVQVGAYASRGDATRAASQLGDGVRYRIEPVQGIGATLYRVVLGGFLDEDDALAAQLRYAEAGFTGARVLRPF
jgi:cell division protein FtsN